jgi:hypothetical protein
MTNNSKYIGIEVAAMYIPALAQWILGPTSNQEQYKFVHH